MIIDINKIILFFVLSIYSGFLSILVGHKFSFLSMAFILIMCFFIYSFILDTLKKIDVESSIDVMNIKLMQDGLLNSIKKDK